MNRDSVALFGKSVGLACLLLFFFVGWGPIVQTLYSYGLWPRPTLDDVQNELRRKDPRDTITCFPASDRFEFVCDVIHRPNPGYVSHHKYGIVGGPFGPIGRFTMLPAEFPLPSPEDQARLDREWQQEQKQLALIDLNRASLAQLEALPGVDRALALRILQARGRTRFKRVDDLLLIDGLDWATVQRLRPLVRVDSVPGVAREGDLGLSGPGRHGAAAVPSKPVAEPRRQKSAKLHSDTGFTEYQLPAGQVLSVRMRTSARSQSSRPGDEIETALIDAVAQDANELLPAGSKLLGSVVDAVPASPERPARLVLAFSVIEHARTGSRAAINTQPLTIEAAPTLGKRRINVELTAGQTVRVVLRGPLFVHIPVAEDATPRAKPTRPSRRTG